MAKFDCTLYSRLKFMAPRLDVKSQNPKTEFLKISLFPYNSKLQFITLTIYCWLNRGSMTSHPL